MKLVFISDTHTKHRAFTPPKGDVLIHCGDFTGNGKPLQAEEFAEWFGEQPHKHKICIAGNHDGCFETVPTIARDIMQRHWVTYLEDSGVTIDGIKFWGSPITPEFNNWYFNRARGAQIKRHWDLIPDDTDVLITHGPPHGVLDKCPMSVGCEELLKAVQRVQPRIHAFGHIHEGGGARQIGPTHFINCSMLDGWYKPVRKPTVFNINRLTLE